MKRAYRLMAIALIALVAAGITACGHRHKYEVVERVEASCLTDGILREKCKCGDTRETVLPATGHNFGTDNKCKNCGYTIVPTEGLAYYETEDGTGYEVAIGSATEKDIVVAAYEKEKPVVGVHEEGFACLDGSKEQGGKNVETVTLHEGITTIGVRAFYGCKALKKVVIPRGLLTIGDLSFRECTSLAEIEGGKDVKTVGKNAFYGCSALLATPAFEGVETVDDYAFSNCGKLESANILGASLKNLGKGVFLNCTALKYATLSGEIETLPQSTFAGCTALKEVRLGGKLKHIGSSAFLDCDVLTTIRFDGSMETWKAVECATDWFMSSGGDAEEFAKRTYYVYCTDGILNRYGFETLPPNE